MKRKDKEAALLDQNSFGYSQKQKPNQTKPNQFSCDNEEYINKGKEQRGFFLAHVGHARACGDVAVCNSSDDPASSATGNEVRRKLDRAKYKPEPEHWFLIKP